MSHPPVKEFKTFIPAKDYEVSRQFYLDLGFEITWEAPGHLTVFTTGVQLFAVQNAFLAEPAGDYVMHLLVPDVDQWYEYLLSRGLNEKYDTKIRPAQMRPWGLRDMFFRDPGGVFWRIAEAGK
jgi:hypothetical protein